MISREQKLLLKLIEENASIQKVTSRGLAQGLDAKSEKGYKDVREELTCQINKFVTVLHLLAKENLLNKASIGKPDIISLNEVEIEKFLAH